MRLDRLKDRDMRIERDPVLAGIAERHASLLDQPIDDGPVHDHIDGIPGDGGDGVVKCDIRALKASDVTDGLVVRIQRIAQVADILHSTGLPAKLLELEVTETLLISNPDQALATLHELQDMGVHIACDDFGTGYSSFRYLQKLAFNRIKIDRSFVQELGTNPAAMQIVKAILAMALSVDMDVTAEGVETEQQFAMLRDQGCTEIQGFLLGRPMPSDEVAHCLGIVPVAETGRMEMA